MQRGFGGPVFEPVQERFDKQERLDRQDRLEKQERWDKQERQDKEITLGSASLLVLGFALFALCALCFGFGYAIGHRSPIESDATSLAAAEKPPATLPPGTGQSKPSAAQNNASPQPQAAGAAPVDADTTPAAPADESAVAVPVAAAQTRTETGAAPAEAVVRTALPAQPGSAQAGAAGGHVEPAVAQSAGVMVQIAAVSHDEDADVLVGALRKRGYAVSARRDPADGLLHVQVGPFVNRSDALAMRQRLLNDGYNAIVQ